MSTETANLIVACASLVVMVVTFFITFWMLVYMKKSDLMKSKNDEKRRKKDIMAQIESKKKQLEKANKLGVLSTECSHRYSPLRSGGCNGSISTDRQPEGLQHMRMVVAALQAAFVGGVPLTQGSQGVAAGLHLLQPYRLRLLTKARL